jgi:hypothetical protein
VKKNKQSAKRGSSWMLAIPFITSMTANMILGALMALADNLWDRPAWIDWIPPGVLFAICGGLTAGSIYLLTMAKFNIKGGGSLIYPASVFLASCLPMMLIWDKYSCNGFDSISGLLTLAGFIIMGFVGMLFPVLFFLIKSFFTGERLFAE